MADRVTITRLGAPLLTATSERSFGARLRWLRRGPPLGPTEARIHRPGFLFHTFGRERATDVAFLDADGVILRLATLSPSRFALSFRARVAIEMAPGTAARLDLARGHVLRLSAGT